MSAQRSWTQIRADVKGLQRRISRTTFVCCLNVTLAAGIVAFGIHAHEAALLVVGIGLSLLAVFNGTELLRLRRSTARFAGLIAVAGKLVEEHNRRTGEHHTLDDIDAIEVIPIDMKTL